MAPASALEGFLRESGETRTAGGRFEAESERMLRIDLDGGVWLKPGAAVAYRGEIAFARLPTLGAPTIADAARREIAPLVRATGEGRLYCGYDGSFVRVVRLAGEAIMVSWQELLAVEDSLHPELTFIGHAISAAAGGLTAVRLSGHGALALSLHGEPLTLMVSANQPVSTDPRATVAWSASLTPTLKTDLTWRSLFGHGGQQPFQMLFAGDGFVVVQPHKDPRRIHSALAPLPEFTSLLTGI